MVFMEPFTLEIFRSCLDMALNSLISVHLAFSRRWDQMLVMGPFSIKHTAPVIPD